MDERQRILDAIDKLRRQVERMERLPAVGVDADYALLAGRAGGQELKGGTGSGDDLTLESTDHATKGYVLIQPNGGRTGFRTAAPAALLHLLSTAAGGSADQIARILAENTSAGGGFAEFQQKSDISDVRMGTGGTGTSSFGLGAGAAYLAAITNHLLVLATNSLVRLYVSAAGDVGIGPSAPAAKLHVVQATLGSLVQRLQSTATNDDTIEDVVQGRIATTDATVTTLHTFTIPASTSVAIKAVVVARRTGGTAGTAEDGAAYNVEGLFKNVAGVATAIGTPAKPAIGESQAAWDITVDVTGATARIRVTGALDNNVTWHMTARVYSVSS